MDGVPRLRVLSRRPLSLHGLAAASPHVRAASGLAWWDGELAIIQDDAADLVIASTDGAAARVVRLLPAHEAATFDERAGTKAYKPDFEALVVVDGALFGLGSGSSGRRRRIAVWSGSEVRLVGADRWYELLAGLPERSAELNLEGAAAVGDALVVALRSNGEAVPGRAKADLLVWFDARALSSWWIGGCVGAPPTPTDVAEVRLGDLDGTRLTITDLTARDGELWFAASAEASPDAIRDGDVAGSAIGRWRPTGAVWARLGAPGGASPDKVEGIVADPTDARRFWLVTDADDPDVPASLLHVEVDLNI